jgi:hypothetical protein
MRIIPSAGQMVSHVAVPAVMNLSALRNHLDSQGEQSLTLEELCADPKEIHNTPLTSHTVQCLVISDAVRPLRQLHPIFREKVRKVLRAVTALVIICAGIAAMLRAVNVREVDAEERVRDPSPRRQCEPRKPAVDDEYGKNGEDNAPLKETEPNVGFQRSNYAVAVEVEKVAVLLQNLGLRFLIKRGGRGSRYMRTVW